MTLTLFTLMPFWHEGARRCVWRAETRIAGNDSFFSCSDCAANLLVPQSFPLH